MNPDTLLAFVRFHAWANDRILTTVAGLSDDEFRAPAEQDHGSALQRLRHLMDVDWSWRQFFIGNNVGETYVWATGSCSTTCQRSMRSASKRTCACGATWSLSMTRLCPSHWL